MPLLRFADGITLNTGGRYRVVKILDDLYVVGQGHFAPVSDRKQAERMWVQLTHARENEQEGSP